jgi:hypothetical protein
MEGLRQQLAQYFQAVQQTTLQGCWPEIAAFVGRKKTGLLKAGR